MDQDKSPQKTVKLLTVTYSVCFRKKHKNKENMQGGFPQFSWPFSNTLWLEDFLSQLLIPQAFVFLLLMDISSISFSWHIWYLYILLAFSVFCQWVPPFNKNMCGKNLQRFLLYVLNLLWKKPPTLPPVCFKPAVFQFYLGSSPVFLEIQNIFFSLSYFNFFVPPTFSPHCHFSKLANPNQLSLFLNITLVAISKIFSSSIMF